MALSVSFALHGVSVTYTPNGGEGVAATALRGAATYRDGENVSVAIGRRIYRFIKADLSVTPGRGDTIADGSDAWRVLEPVDEDPTGELWIVEAEKVGR